MSGESMGHISYKTAKLYTNLRWIAVIYNTGILESSSFTLSERHFTVLD